MWLRAGADAVMHCPEKNVFTPIEIIEKVNNTVVD